jgi:hypothetical protein
MNQWEIWKGRPAGMAHDHWFVLLSGQERLASPRHQSVNGLACFTLRGGLGPTDVMLNSADGFQTQTACQCDLIYLLEKGRLHSRIGLVSFDRQQAIKRKLIQLFRMVPA